MVNHVRYSTCDFTSKIEGVEAVLDLQDTHREEHGETGGEAHKPSPADTRPPRCLTEIDPKERLQIAEWADISNDEEACPTSLPVYCWTREEPPKVAPSCRA